MVAAVGALVVVFAIIKLFGQSSSSQSYPSGSQPPGMLAPGGGQFQPFAGNEITENEPVKEYKFLLDPFQKPDKIILEKKEAKRELLKLEGILWSEDKPLAVINGEVYGLDEEVEGFKVKRIEKAEVEFIKDGSSYILTLEGSSVLQERR